MKTTTKIIFSALFVLAGIFSTQPVKATDGYFGVGYGAQNKGLAGAGIAWYKNSLINGNPAGHVFLGKQYQVGVGFFNPNREYTVTGNPSPRPAFGLAPGTVESDSKIFFIPNFGANWMLNEKSSFSVAMYGNGGMNTDYPTMTFGDTSSETTGVDLGQMFVGLTYSRKIAEKHSFGVTAIAAYQYFEAKGLGAFGQNGMSSDMTKLTDNGHDNAFGVGFKLGYLGQLSEKLSIGASYQTMVYMSEFDDYAGLFAEQGDFNIPSTWTVGLAYQANENWVFAADFKRINYKDVASVSNKMRTPMDPAFTPLGSDKGAGFGWEDINVIKVGAEYAGIDTWTLRAGYSHCDQPIKKSEVLFNILAPGIIEDHITIGCSKAIGDSGKALHLALVYAMPASVKGYNPMDFDAAQAMQGNMVPNQTIELEMNQIEVEIAFTF
ncbi:outer membrane protein transport protein [Labilibaculum sp. DW002]|uniref:Outer membrane protein transport protein n=1 Tax=Paralabilibaculum antarcticum TaxID=2912572 RepID=A0ABT5VXY2_9BACT|nr:outer membrane protein transport protein [Labilibaculum sp. DW002]MDE5420277.1 outer membrane protein transport protein [Labilibaculum sp. DW002]